MHPSASPVGTVVLHWLSVCRTVTRLKPVRGRLRQVLYVEQSKIGLYGAVGCSQCFRKSKRTVMMSEYFLICVDRKLKRVCDHCVNSDRKLKSQLVRDRVGTDDSMSDVSLDSSRHRESPVSLDEDTEPSSSNRGQDMASSGKHGFYTVKPAEKNGQVPQLFCNRL